MESKHYSWSKDRMKMIINTDFKKFNKQTNYIGTGNVIANTQYGNYIRPYDETVCNETHFPKGNLQDYDLQGFHIQGQNDLEYFVRNQKHSVVLYEFFIYKNNGLKDIIGWLIEDNGKIVYQKLRSSIFDRLDYMLKRQNVLDYMTNLLEEERSVK